jgi:hypothetical protein
MQEKNSVGQNIDSYCGKCKLNLDHTIMVMDGETMARVRCKSCGSSHKFRSPLELQKVRKPRVKKDIGDEATAQSIWEAGLAEAKGNEGVYSMVVKYRIGDIVNHQTFGKGVVMKVYPNKCDILFKDRERLMASTNK